MFQKKLMIVIPIVVLLAFFVCAGCKSGYKTVPCPRFHHIGF